MRLVFVCLCLVSFLFSQEVKEENRVVKTSELELFLFKVGFQSLLSDVDITKDKAIENEKSIVELKNRVKIIMDEVYKDKRVLVEKNENISLDRTSKDELLKLKEQIEYLQKEVALLKEIKNKTIIKEKIANNVFVNTSNSNVRVRPNTDSKIVFTLNKGEKVDLKSCNKFDWCEIEVKNKKGFIAKFLLNL